MATRRNSGLEGWRTAIVTGGASGIGRALGEELATGGVRVVLADRQVAVAEGVAAEIRERGGAASAAELDVRRAEQFQCVVDTVVRESGRLDYLFNNAGIGAGGEIRDYAAPDWDDVIDVNLRGVAHGVQAAYPRMIEQGSGHIVNTASMAGLGAGAMSGSYSATKHAVVGLSRTLRVEAQQYGVRVSVLCPGVIRTPILTGGHYGRIPDGFDPGLAARFFESYRPMEPAAFARRVVRALERNPAFIIVPGWWRLVWYLDRASPWLGERFAVFSLRRLKRLVEEKQT